MKTRTTSTFVFSFRRVAAVTLCVAALGVASACEPAEEEAELPPIETAERGETTLPEPGVVEDEAPLTPTQPGAVAVRLTEWDLQVSSDTVPAGETVFEITNAGTVPHAFEVEGQGMEEETENLQPGANTTLTVDLQRGRYVLYCPVVANNVNHQDEGMTTTLYVQ